jgi:uncharacterized membrane protein YeaQ/YmgE (transglycosylase-associated protein family)
MDLSAILAQVIGGALGGTAGGKIIKDSDLGSLGNIIAGGIGGLGGNALLTAVLGSLGSGAGGMDIGVLAGQLVGGGITGLIVQVVVGLIKNKLVAAR